MREKIQDFLSGKVGVLALTVVLFIIMVLIYVALIEAGLVPALLIFAVAFVYFGWKALNKITPKWFVWMPIIGWVIYFTIKLVLSVVAGYFVAPYQLAKLIAKAFSK